MNQYFLKKKKNQNQNKPKQNQKAEKNHQICKPHGATEVLIHSTCTFHALVFFMFPWVLTRLLSTIFC